jgi:protein O-GlcNAc transferase
MLNQALELHKAGQWSSAEKIYWEILKKEPNNKIALNNLAVMCFQHQRYSLCENLLDKSIKVDNKNKDTLENILILQVKVKDVIKAYKTLDYCEKNQIKSEKIEILSKTIKKNYHNLIDQLKIIDYVDIINNIENYSIHVNTNKIISKEKLNLELQNNIIKLIDNGKLQEAEDELKALLIINPKEYNLLNNLAIVYRKTNKLNMAFDKYTEAIKVDPSNHIAYKNLGIMLSEIKNYSFSEVILKISLKLHDSNEVRICLANNFKQSNRINEAIKEYLNIIKNNSKDFAAYFNLGSIYIDEKEYDRAIKCFEKSIENNKLYVNSYINYALALSNIGNKTKAIEILEKAKEISSYNRNLLNNLGNLYSDLGRDADAVKCYKQIIDRSKNDYTAWSNYLYALTHISTMDEKFKSDEHKKFGNLFDYVARPKVKNIKDNKIKIGFVSGDFYDHAVSGFLLPILKEMNKNEFQILLFYNGKITDYITENYKNIVDKFFYINEYDDKNIFNLIQGLDIDVLVDLSGHTKNNRLPLFAMRPAPLQISMIGYPNTTGLKQIDYIVVDQFVPASLFKLNQYSEKFIVLPSNMCHRMLSNIPDEHQSPFINNKYITFGCFNRAAKYNNLNIEIWSKVIKRVKNSKILIGGVSEDEFNIICEKFNKFGINKSKIKHQNRLSTMEFMRSYSQVDIMLDTWPYSSGTMMLHAIYMGVPTIALKGDTRSGNFPYSVNQRLGLDKFNVENISEYEDCCIKISKDYNSLIDIRQKLRSIYLNSIDFSPSFVSSRFQNAVKEALLKVVNDLSLDDILIEQ